MFYQIKYTSIMLDGLELKSDKYSFTLSNIFDFDKSYSSSDTYSNGKVYASSKVEDKKILLNGYVKGDITDFLALNKMLNRKDLLTLKVAIEGFKTLEAKVLIGNKGISTDGVNAFSCELIAFDPYLYGDKSSVEFGIETYEGMKFPIKFPIAWNGVSHTIKALINNGNTESYPIITITGPCSNIVISNITTGEAIWINVVLTQYDVLVIDNTEENRGIYLNGKRNIELKNGNWLECIEGVNSFSVFYQSNSNNKLVKIEMIERFI